MANQKPEPQEMTEVKIAYIGGGSRQWARTVVQDLALCPGLGGHLALYDIDYPAARRNCEWARAVFGHPQARARFSVSVHRKLAPALRGAQFVFISILPGPMTMMASDIDIPARYGILQPVGDTTGPGGVVRALRSVPIYMEFARAVMESCPEAWVVSFSNPMALCVAALYRAAPQIKAYGYCHEVMFTRRLLARLVEQYLGVEAADWREVELEVAGVNHFTLARSASWRGHDLFPMLERHISAPGFFADRTADALRRKAEGRWFQSDELVKFDFFRRFGVLGAAGDRHLVEFVPWYLRSEAELHRWGVVLTPSSYRLRSRPERPESGPIEVPAALRRSGQEVLDQVCALVGLGDLEATANVPNRGQLPDWPTGAVIESNVLFKQGQIVPMTLRAFPAAVTALQRRTMQEQRLVLEAAVRRDFDLALQALLLDPLVTISTDRAQRMLREMLLATRAMLPGWKL